MANKALYDLTLKISMQSAELSKGIKEANSKIDSFKNNTENSIKAVKGAFIGVIAVIGSLKGAFEVLKTGLNQTGSGADFLEKKTAALSEGFKTLAKDIVNLDFSHIESGMRNAMKATEEYIESLDRLHLKEMGLSMFEAQNSARLKELRYKVMTGKASQDEIDEYKKDLDLYYKNKIEATSGKILSATEFFSQKSGIIISPKDIQEGFLSVATMDRDQLSKNEEKAKAVNEQINELKKNINVKTGFLQKAAQTGVPFATLLANAFGDQKKQIEAEINFYNQAQKIFDSLTPAEKLQYFIDYIDNENSEKFKDLVNNFNELKRAQDEYYSEMILVEKQTNKLNKKNVKSKKDIKEPERPDTILNIKENAKDFEAPDIELNIPEPKKLSLIKKELEEIGETVRKQINREDIYEAGTAVSLLANSFGTLAESIRRTSSSSANDFSKGMSIIADSARITIATLEALAAAGLISKEVLKKGFVGILTATAGLASLMALFASYASPKKYALGTNYAEGGWSLVGEKGPELINLPRGSRVIPNNKLSTVPNINISLDSVIRGKDIALALRRIDVDN